MAETIVIEGVVEEIIFSNIANGYTVCDIDVDGVFSTAVGNMPGLAPGESVRLTGKWTSHAEYGEQFKVDFFERILPTGKKQILMYLSSGIIKGIGPATAQKIVSRFGEDALVVIRDMPNELAKIKGISRKKAEEMQASILEKQTVQSVVMFLQPYGVTANFAVKVYKKFGISAIAEIEKNPYVLCDIDGIGFKTADKIAMQMGVDACDASRMRSGIIFVLKESAGSGHTYLPFAQLVRIAKDMLGADMTAIENAISGMLLTGALIQEVCGDETFIYLPVFFHAEVGVARRLYAIMEGKRTSIGVSAEAAVLSAESRCGITLSKEQRSACVSVMNEGAAIITGGPGTGKTTVINAVIDIMQSAGLSVALCAPTGRAAKRLAETCGMDAKTVHRLLELNFSGEGTNQIFGRNEEVPLDEDVIIVDEMSMVDIQLMYALLRALRPGCRLIMVGDADQLTSVGAGNVLRDMIQSGKVPVCKLTDIYRQAAESMIVVNAHKINNGERPILNQKNKDFFFMHHEDAKDIQNIIGDLCSVRLPRAYNFDAISQIQVICPSKKTALGVTVLNKHLQACLNPPSPDKNEKTVGEMIYREGDKVMQVRNNYDIMWHNADNSLSGEGAFNGDVGIIQHVNLQGQYLEVCYDGERIIRYDFTQLEELELAYAVTVHKSQGSEFEAVIIPMYPVAPQLMCRNLLYTAVTRAKKLAILIGREHAMETMISNNRQTARFSGLARKIEGIFNV